VAIEKGPLVGRHFPGLAGGSQKDSHPAIAGPAAIAVVESQPELIEVPSGCKRCLGFVVRLAVEDAIE